MSHTIEVKPISATPYLGIRRTVHNGNFGPVMGEILPATFGYVAQHGLQPASPPVCLYFEHNPEAHTWVVVGGVFLNAPVTAPDGFESGVLPAGEVAETLLVGPYDRIGAAHEAVEAWFKANGRETAGPCWDVYENDPGEVADPNLYQTRVVWPIKPKA
jgi:effector-binding domain-containing protein